MNYCPTCGARAEKLRYCGQCGLALMHAVPTPPPSQKGKSFSIVRVVKLLAAIAVGAIVFVMVLGRILTTFDPPPNGSNAIARTLDQRHKLEIDKVPAWVISEAKPLSPATGLTMASFEAIRTGMTYQDVVAIVGSTGQEMSRSDIAGHTTVMYMWKQWTGANMNAMFQNGGLVTKAQFGLK